MMKEYAAEAGLRRRLVPALPIPAPKLAGMWVVLTTPIPLSMSLPLVQPLLHDAVSGEHDIDSLIPVPAGGLTPYRGSCGDAGTPAISLPAKWWTGGAWNGLTAEKCCV